MEQRRRLFSYVVKHDLGFAPHVQDGILSLATCKPKIRVAAKRGDWLAGTSSREYSNSNFRLLYLMQVTEEPMTADVYDTQYPERRPSPTNATGDSLYYLDEETASVVQRSNPWHGPKDMEKDLSGVNVLVSRRFVYFGRNMPDIPDDLLKIVKKGPAHRNKFSDEQIQHLIDWVTSIVGADGWNKSYGLPNQAKEKAS